jgi:hypothetical protein
MKEPLAMTPEAAATPCFLPISPTFLPIPNPRLPPALTPLFLLYDETS